MKCGECRRSIAAGIEAKRMICEYQQDDGTTKLFGHQMPDGALDKATGRLVTGWHNRCYWALRKRAARDSTQAGLKIILNMGGSYDIAEHTLTGEEAQYLDPAETGKRIELLREELIARGMLRRVTDRREADPGHVDPAPADWRDQTELDL